MTRFRKFFSIFCTRTTGSHRSAWTVDGPRSEVFRGDSGWVSWAVCSPKLPMHNRLLTGRSCFRVCGHGQAYLLADWKVFLLMTTLGVLFSSGCGPRTDRLPISGRVTLDDMPLDRGSIRFTSLEGEQLLASGALIREGRYNIQRDKGLRPGRYRVQITSPDMEAPPVMAPKTPSGPSFPVPPERIPPEYNVESDKTIDVTANGKNDFVFEIKSRRAT